MEKLIYNKTLKDHLAFIKTGSDVLTNLDETKTIEKFKTELAYMKDLLKIAEAIVNQQI